MLLTFFHALEPLKWKALDRVIFGPAIRNPIFPEIYNGEVGEQSIFGRLVKCLENNGASLDENYH